MLANSLNLPKPFVDAVSEKRVRSDTRYSVTETLGGTCEAVLRRRHADDIDDDVADRVWAILGTAVHKVLQESDAEPWQEREQYIKVPIEGTRFELSGIFDMYDKRERCVTDWKTCSVWKTQVGDFEDWRKQLAAYCWMLERSGEEAREGEIVAIMRDHSMRKARFEKGYPPHPVMRIAWRFDDADMEEVGVRLGRWFLDLEDQLGRADEDLVPCSPDERWSKPETWAVMRSGRKKAVRVFGSEEEAVGFVGDGPDMHIERRKGEDVRCQSYCPVARWCPYGGKISQDSENSQNQPATTMV